MRIRELSVAIVLILVFASHQARMQGVAPVRIEKSTLLITEGWRFRQADLTVWYPATVPGCVHTDLMKNGLIDDPFYRDNEQKLQWIGKVDWVYQTSFAAGPELNRSHVELVFEGLDT